MQDIVTGIVLVIANPESKEVLERWQFDIACDKTATEEKSWVFCEM